MTKAASSNAAARKYGAPTSTPLPWRTATANTCVNSTGPIMPVIARRLPRKGEIAYALYLGNDRFNVTAGTDNITDLSGSDILVVSAGATAAATVTAAFTATSVSSNAGTATLTTSGQTVNLDRKSTRLNSSH